MKVTIILLAVIAVCCMISVDARSSRLALFLKKLNAKKAFLKFRVPAIHSLLQRINKSRLSVFKPPVKGPSESIESNEESNEESREDEEEEEVNNVLANLYKELCSASCKRSDRLCVKVMYRYLTPLCKYKDETKAAKALIKQLSCSEMTSRVKLICRASKNSKGCEYAEQVAEFCLAATTEPTTTTTEPTTTTTEPTTTTTEPTTTTTEPTTTTTEPTTTTTEPTTTTTEPTTTTTEPTTTSTTTEPTTTKGCNGLGTCMVECSETSVPFPGGNCGPGESCCIAVGRK